jgi:uncharacterized membrane protein YeaQ/YmgE (transglycosylase-associated protein family)
MAIISWISWVVVGMLAGFLTGLIMGRVERNQVYINIAAGVGGAIVGGLIMALGSGLGLTSFSWSTYLAAVAGAIIAVLIVSFTIGARE